MENDLLSGFSELLDVVTFDILILYGDDARGFPFSILAELDVADDCLERGLVQIFGHLSVVETTDRRDGLLENLHLRIGEWRDVQAEHIDTSGGGARLVL